MRNAQQDDTQCQKYVDNSWWPMMHKCADQCELQYHTQQLFTLFMFIRYSNTRSDFNLTSEANLSLIY